MEEDGAHGRRTFLKAAGSAAAAVSVAGCIGGGNDGGGDGPSGTIQYTRGSGSQTLDIHNTTSGEVAKVTNQIYDKLIEFKPGKNQIKDGLAKEYNFDGKTATLTLREGVKFHNGEEFTAQDFKATYRRFTDSNYKHYPGVENVSAYAGITFGKVKSVTVKGDYKLEFQLKQKYAPFLRNLAIFAAGVLSKKEIESKTKFSTNAVGTGPFKLEEYKDSGNRILLSYNENYWGKGPKVEKVVFNTVGENSTRAQKLINGGTQLIDGVDAEAANQIKKSDGVELKQFKGANTGYMALNMARFEPFRKKKVRQAMNYAIDTEVIVNKIFAGFAEQSSHPLPKNILGYNKNLDPYPHDPKKAKQLLKEAGHGGGLEFELATFKNPRPYIPSPVDAAQQVRTDLGKVGVSITINQMSWDPFLNYTTSGKHDACFLGWMVDNGDPDNFYYSLLHPGVKSPPNKDWVSFDTKGYNTTNASAWANKKFMDTITEAQKISNDKTKRGKRYHEAGKITHEEAPWVFLNHADELRGVASSVSEYTPAAIGGPFLRLISVK